MHDSDLSSIYEHAREIINNSPKGVYVKKKKELRKRVAAEKKEYISAAGKKSTKLIFVIPIVCVCLALTIVYFIKVNDESVQNIPTFEEGVETDVYVTQAQEVIMDASETQSTTYSESEKSNDDVSLITSFESITESETEVEETTVLEEITETTLPEFDEDSVESYNGFKLGDIVYYSGTVHYVSSNSKKLGGACHGGMAMISGIKPDAMHKFHLVAADDDCTVYGWVDEAFVKPVDSIDATE